MKSSISFWNPTLPPALNGGVEYDQGYLELTNQEYIAPEDQNLVGAPGQQKFEFKAIKAGDTQTTFSYSRPWEKDVEPVKKAVYDVIIR